MAAGAVSLKNLTKCEEVRKGADQAKYILITSENYPLANNVSI